MNDLLIKRPITDEIATAVKSVEGFKHLEIDNGVWVGFHLDAWDELVCPVFEERFEEVHRYPGSAILPTETQLTRKAISAGFLPA